MMRKLKIGKECNWLKGWPGHQHRSLPHANSHTFSRVCAVDNAANGNIYSALFVKYSLEKTLWRQWKRKCTAMECITFIYDMWNIQVAH